MKLAKTMSESRRLLEQLNRMRKVDSLIKGTIAAMGAGGAGMYFGASEQRKNPDFYNPEDNPFRRLFGSPERQMGSGVALDAVEEALEDMDNKINGREQ